MASRTQTYLLIIAATGFQLKQKDPDIRKIVLQDQGNHGKVALFQNYLISTLTGHILLSQGETSGVIQQKLLTVILVNLNRLLTVTWVNLDSSHLLKRLTLKN